MTNRISAALLSLVRRAHEHKRGGMDPHQDMTISITVLPGELIGLLDGFSGISAKLDQILKEQQTMATTLDALTAQVAANTTVEKSALALIQGFAAKLDAAKTDPAAIQALVNELKSADDELAAAVAANTTADTGGATGTGSGTGNGDGTGTATGGTTGPDTPIVGDTDGNMA